MRALRSLEPLTGPTSSERQRIRDRILLTLDADAGDSGEPSRPATSVAPADASTEVEPSTADEDMSRPEDAPRPKAAGKRAATPEDGDSGTSRPVTPRGRSRPGESRRRHVLAGARGRLAIASLALLALVGSLAGMSVLLSRDALPGDALYGVKRTAEAASLGLTFGDESKALKHLEFAAARVTEIETLARRYPNPDDAPVGGYLTALTDFDNDAAAGSRQLINIATSTGGQQLDALRDWSTQQASRLQRVATNLPAAARSRDNASRVMLDRITARADALSARMDCFQITSGSFDDIGALPATGTCEKRNPAPTSGTAPTSVPGATDIPGSPTGAQTPSAPLPSADPTPAVPPVPVPGATVTVPLPTERPPLVTTTAPTTPPLIQLPPLLPGLPSVGIG